MRPSENPRSVRVDGIRQSAERSTLLASEVSPLRGRYTEKMVMEYVTLNDGNRLPAIGYGLPMIADQPEKTYNAVKQALEMGYRLIDTAAAYLNEEQVGRAVRDLNIPRGDVYITSKLWLQDYGYEEAKKGIDASLEKLGLGYIDLYLLHHPYFDVVGAWKALEEAKAAGKIRSIGVSNMTLKLWNTYIPQFKVLPAVNQVEFNPFCQQPELRKVLDPLDVKIEAYLPLAKGRKELLEHPFILSLAKKYGKDPGQIILRFEVQCGVIPVARLLTPVRADATSEVFGFEMTPEEMAAANLKIFDFALTEEEMREMETLNENRCEHNPEAPGVEEILLNTYKVHD